MCLFQVTCKGASLKVHDKIFTWITMQVTGLSDRDYKDFVSLPFTLNLLGRVNERQGQVWI